MCAWWPLYREGSFRACRSPGSPYEPSGHRVCALTTAPRITCMCLSLAGRHPRSRSGRFALSYSAHKNSEL